MVYFATACFLAYVFSGHSGIYLSQRVGIPKTRRHAPQAGIPLRQIRSERSARRQRG